MSLSAGEILAIDSMSQEFKNFRIGTLLGQAINGQVPIGGISTEEIADLAITTAKLAANAVTNAKLGTDVKAGSLAALTTSDKTSLQAAINELVTSIAAALVQTSEIKNLLSGVITLNGANPSPVSFQGDLAATETSSNAETYDLASIGDGGTLIINPDGNGNETATFNFAEGNSISAGSPSIDITASIDNKFKISVRGDAAETVELTIAGGLNSGANIAAEMQTRIRALGGNKALVTVDHNVTEAAKYAIVDNVEGTSSTIVITPADDNNITEELKIGVGDGGAENTGTGDVANALVVTAAEIAALVSSDMAGLSASGATGSVVFTSDTDGKDSSLVMGNGSLNGVVGITNTNAFYGAQGLGFAADMANTDYRVLPVLSGVAAASLASLNLSITSKGVATFQVECETTASAAVVDLFIVGESA